MKKAFLFLFITGLVISFACQNKLDKDEEILTTVQGKVINESGNSIQDATIDIDSVYITKSDTSGDFSLAVTHNGTFILNVTHSRFKTKYTETIDTENILVTRTITMYN